MLILVFTFFVCASSYQQSDYFLSLQRMDTVSYNKGYFNYLFTRTFKYNRTAPAINITWDPKTAFGYELKVKYQTFKMASNDYRLFPISQMFDYCNFYSLNNFGMQNLAKHGNFTGCPFKKEKLIAYNFAPDYSKFPPYVPGGDYRSEVDLVFRSVEVAKFHMYFLVTPKNPWE